MARPKSEKYDIAKMVDIIDKYWQETEIPIVKEVCLLNNWVYEYVCDLASKHDELSYAIKRLTARKEIVLETGALKGVYDKTMAIFSLKQMGWKDRQEVELNDRRKIEIVDDLPNEG